MRVDLTALPVLQLEDIDTESVTMLRARGAAYAKAHAQIEGAQTVLLKNLAMVILAIRKKHDDWDGKSYEYRQDVAEMYRQAGIPKDSMSSLQSAVRYHVGNAVRRYLTPREMKRLAIADTTPLERQQDRRASDSLLLSALKVSAAASAPVSKGMAKTKTMKPAKGTKAAPDPSERVPEQGSDIKATADHLRLTHAARQLVEQLDADVIRDHMTEGQRAKLDEDLAAMQEIISALRRRTRSRRSEA
ncbi:hypothetical protein [Streptomyces sp. NPDC004528]|uniref:hypothetical protein n=1 Tax=Streptomyces sp. NPDC004528 TaxID=3154550 RepID=UPI00339FEA99